MGSRSPSFFPFYLNWVYRNGRLSLKLLCRSNWTWNFSCHFDSMVSLRRNKQGIVIFAVLFDSLSSCQDFELNFKSSFVLVEMREVFMSFNISPNHNYFPFQQSLVLLPNLERSIYCNQATALRSYCVMGKLLSIFSSYNSSLNGLFSRLSSVIRWAHWRRVSF